ncbi:MAG TPA: universal stress protein [Gemmatimonadaceae bacterium]
MSVSAELSGITSSAIHQLDPEHLFRGHLLLASDGSVSADGAVALVTALRRQGPLKLEVLAVFEPAPMPVPSLDPSLAAMTTMAGDEVLRAEFFSRVDRQLERAFTGLPPVPMQHAEGSPVRCIVETAQRSQADLVITGLRVHTLLDRLVGDETALRVTRGTDRPVFAVAPTLTQPPRRAVVGIDFSRASLRAAHAAAGMLVDGGTLTLLHARPSLDAATAAADGLDVPYARGVTAALDGLRTAIISNHPHITVEVERRDGDPAESVLNFAVASTADFMAVGRHRRNAISHAILGSVATTLLRKAQLSVLVLPPMKEDSQ